MIEGLLDFAASSDIGTERPGNEDACGILRVGEDCGVVVVADGVSLANAGEVASALAVEVVLRAFQEEPAEIGAGARLYRAFQQANIEIYDKQIAVPELRGMSTTLTAVVVDRGELTAVHVGDSRLYLLREGSITQLTKDHTVAAEKVRLKVMSKEKARVSADRSVLTRSMGRELIVARDRLSQRLRQGDALLLCSDGLHGVLPDEALARLVGEAPAAEACRALLEAANSMGTPDNLTAAVLRVVGPLPDGGPAAPGLGQRLKRLFGSV